MAPDRLLEVKDLKTYFYTEDKVAKAVDGVTFHVNKGETVAIVGESGSGKSVTSLSVMRLIPEPPGKVVEGSITFDGQDILQFSEKQMTRVRGNDIAMIFQEPMTSLNPVFTIGNQIAEAVIRHEGLHKQKAYERANDLLKMVGFPRAEETVHEYPHQLSGGMRQRAMIAMALSCKPQLIIADEPTTALDVTVQAQILDLLHSVKEEHQASILLITHDLGVVAEMADRVIVMYGGQVVEEAAVEALFEHPLHPYTIGLLNSIPRMEEERKRLDQIPGTVPPAHNFPRGCRFASRCSQAMPECTQEPTTLIEVEPEHKVRCVLYKGQEETRG
ncbi:ABC transporter ATP-binding protein [Caldalkalibacillus salinus]|uniref:ABC transporter ATP-binding protein n=1 Tax=Caldalkalibacillus salinus TaxID=2803787 RepID=UPI00192425A9|nr:ABC transporter ATP-binding protein [Caldalkalibacillus salinus]